MPLVRVKTEPDWEMGVSAAAAREGLYAGHLVKDELVLGPELLQPPDVAYTIQASCNKTSNSLSVVRPCSVTMQRLEIRYNRTETPQSGARPRSTEPELVLDQAVSGTKYIMSSSCNKTSNSLSVVRPCSVTLKRLGTGLGVRYNRTETRQSVARPRSTEPELVTDQGVSATVTHPAVSSNNLDTHSVLTGKPCSVTQERILVNTKLDVSSNISEINQAMTPCSVSLERMAVDKKQGICRLGHRIYQLWSCGGGSEKNIIHSKEPTLRDIIKQFEKQARFATSIKSAKLNKVATKPAEELTFNHVKGELPATSKAYVHDRKAEKEVAISDNDSTQPNKTNLSIIPDYKCDNCGERFKNKSRLKIHILNFLLGYSCGEQIDRKRFKCSCGYQTNIKSTFQVHQMRHRGEKPYKCSYCSYACTDNYTLIVHETTHTREIRFKCDHCNYKTYNKRNLVTHMARHTVGKQFKCGQCDYETQYKSALNAHQLIHTSEKPFKCSRCDFKCKQRSNLRSHEKRHTGYKPFKCDFCEYECGVKYQLKRHERKHTGEKPFKCSFCDFKCSAKKHLIVHERIHTGEKPFKCSYCDYACRQKTNLVAHERVHTGEKPFKCKYCRYCTAQKAHLTTHQRLHTGEKPFKCSDCDYKCNEKYSLKCHQLIHSGEKPYKCSICDYRCRQKTSLRVHQRVHSGEKPYQCTRCDFSCRYKDSLNRHLKKHRGGKSLK